MIIYNRKRIKIITITWDSRFSFMNSFWTFISIISFFFSVRFSLFFEAVKYNWYMLILIAVNV